MIIVDTNVVLSFLLTDGITRKIILQHKDVFISPEHCFNELWEHRGRWNRHGLPEGDLRMIVDKVKKYFVIPVHERYYGDKQEEAEALIDDQDDWPFLALALTVENEGIWTYNTKDFDQEKIKERVKVLGTKDVLDLYPLKE